MPMVVRAGGEIKQNEHRLRPQGLCNLTISVITKKTYETEISQVGELFSRLCNPKITEPNRRDLHCSPIDFGGVLRLGRLQMISRKETEKVSPIVYFSSLRLR